MSIEILILDNLKISEKLEVERSRNLSYIEILIFDKLKIVLMYDENCTKYQEKG